MSNWEDAASRHTAELVKLTLTAANQGSEPLPEDEVARLGMMIATERQLLIDAIAGSMAGVGRPGIIERQLVHFRRVDARLEQGIAVKLGRSAAVASPAGTRTLA